MVEAAHMAGVARAHAGEVRGAVAGAERMALGPARGRGANDVVAVERTRCILAAGVLVATKLRPSEKRIIETLRMAAFSVRR